jgi:hypothetical protein
MAHYKCKSCRRVRYFMASHQSSRLTCIDCLEKKKRVVNLKLATIVSKDTNINN